MTASRCFGCVSFMVAYPRDQHVPCLKCGGFRRAGAQLAVPVPPVLQQPRPLRGRIVRGRAG